MSEHKRAIKSTFEIRVCVCFFVGFVVLDLFGLKPNSYEKIDKKVCSAQKQKPQQEKL